MTDLLRCAIGISRIGAQRQKQRYGRSVLPSNSIVHSRWSLVALVTGPIDTFNSHFKLHLCQFLLIWHIAGNFYDLVMDSGFTLVGESIMKSFSLDLASNQCPLCGGDEISLSRRREIHEFLLLPVLLLRPFRCKDCRHRYYGFVFTHTSALRRPESDPSIIAESLDGTETVHSTAAAGYWGA